MNKTIYKAGLVGILLGAGFFAKAQQDQTTNPPAVGIQTNDPQETLDVRGTARITDLPNSGDGNSYNGEQTKGESFTATKTVVADENGVLGSVPYILPPGDADNTSLRWDNAQSKWVKSSSATSTATEPWKEVGSVNPATAATTTPIYYRNPIGIGGFNAKEATASEEALNISTSDYNHISFITGSAPNYKKWNMGTSSDVFMIGRKEDGVLYKRLILKDDGSLYLRRVKEENEERSVGNLGENGESAGFKYDARNKGLLTIGGKLNVGNLFNNVDNQDAYLGVLSDNNVNPQKMIALYSTTSNASNLNGVNRFYLGHQGQFFSVAASTGGGKDNVKNLLLLKRNGDFLLGKDMTANGENSSGSTLKYSATEQQLELKPDNEHTAPLVLRVSNKGQDDVDLRNRIAFMGSGNEEEYAFIGDDSPTEKLFEIRAKQGYTAKIGAVNGGNEASIELDPSESRVYAKGKVRIDNVPQLNDRDLSDTSQVLMRWIGEDGNKNVVHYAQVGQIKDYVLASGPGNIYTTDGTIAATRTVTVNDGANDRLKYTTRHGSSKIFVFEKDKESLTISARLADKKEGNTGKKGAYIGFYADSYTKELTDDGRTGYIGHYVGDNNDMYIGVDGTDKNIRLQAGNIVGIGFGSTEAVSSLDFPEGETERKEAKEKVKLAVKGAVLAGSFKGANGGTVFPDYVFQKYYTGTSSIKDTYNFSTLSQVESFVKEYGHLPGYKSAAEIKEQGYVDLMDTQITNVEKIEELYLHSIEQDKEIKAQRKEIQAKDAKIEALEARLERLEQLLVK